MKKNVDIVACYTESQDGEEYITKSGNPYLKMMYKEKGGMGDVVYDSFFMTPKAHWKTESLFKAAHANCPAFEDIETAHFNNLIGAQIVIEVGKNKAGYDTVFKHSPSRIEVPQTNADTTELTDDISGQIADDEEEDEIPF